MSDRRCIVVAIDGATRASELSARLAGQMRGGDELIIVSVSDAAAPDLAEVRAAVQALSADAFRDGFIVMPEVREPGGLAAAIRAERNRNFGGRHPVSMGYTKAGPARKLHARRCVKCNAIVSTDQQRCPKCGSRRIQ
jgi:ribosomal protein L40E